MGLFNFRPSVRPVPLEVHIQGFPGQHYCPRMASMNKPAFQGKQAPRPFTSLCNRNKVSEHFTQNICSTFTTCVTLCNLGMYRENLLLLMTQSYLSET